MAGLSDRLLGSAGFSMAAARVVSPLRVFFRDARQVFRMDELGREIVSIALPAALALTADPIASLVDTAFIGRIGPVELAAVGVAIAVFNQASRITIFPLVSVTTSFVAEDDAACEMASEAALEDENDSEKLLSVESEMKELIPRNDPDRTASRSIFHTDESTNGFKSEIQRKTLPSASSALIIGGILGLLQALVLIFGAIPILKFMGLKSDSPMLAPSCQYLTLRSLGAPAVLLSLAMQGIFRGLKDTQTPLYATVAGDAMNVVLDPIFIFVFDLGVSGAAIAHVLSQYLIALLLLWRLMRQVNVLPPSIRDLQFSRFLKNGFLLLARVIAATFCVTLAASMAARQGTVPMAAFQICLQVWLATSLLADGLAVAGQAIVASAFAKRDLARACSSSKTTIVMNGLHVEKAPTLHVEDSLVFEHIRDLYLFHSRKAFDQCMFDQATLVYFNSNSTNFTWQPLRSGHYYFSTKDESRPKCEEGEKVPVRVITPELAPTLPPTTGGDLPALPSPGWALRTSSSPISAPEGTPLEPGEGLPSSSASSPVTGGGIPFISSNPAVPIPTGETDTATIRPLSTPGDEMQQVYLHVLLSYGYKIPVEHYLNLVH